MILHKNYRGRSNSILTIQNKLWNFFDKFNHNLLSGKMFFSLMKFGYRKLQVSRVPSKILQSKGFRGKKSNFVQIFFKRHVKDRPNQGNFKIKTSIKKKNNIEQFTIPQ